MSELAVIRPQVGLMLSIGDPPDEQRNYPKKLDHFRPKPGTEGQYAPAVEKFLSRYPGKPDRLDILLVSNEIADVLDIRYKAWGTLGLKLLGHTNFATCPDRMGGPDDVTVWPDTERESRQGAIEGPYEAFPASIGTKLYGVFRFALEGVTGLTTLCEISTTSRKSMTNLLAGLTQVQELTGGQLAGLPLELAVRPARTRYFDEKERRRKLSTFYELVLQAPGAIDEFFEQAQIRRAQMQGGTPRLELPPIRHDDLERDGELAGPALIRPEGERESFEVTADLPLVRVDDEMDARARAEQDDVYVDEDAEHPAAGLEGPSRITVDQSDFAPPTDESRDLATEAQAAGALTFPNGKWVGKTIAEIHDAGDEGQDYLRWAARSWKDEPLKTAVRTWASVYLP